MTLKRDLRSASGLYRGFREEEPKRAKKVRINVPRAAAVIGIVEFVGYMTTHDGETHLYVHQFAPGSRPILAAGVGKNQAFLIGGRYRVTDRGIVDFGPTGREVRGKERYKIEVIDRS